MNTFGVGELVRVLEDMESVKRLQAGHGEWTDSMAPVCSFSLIVHASLIKLTLHCILALVIVAEFMPYYGRDVDSSHLTCVMNL